MNILLTGARGFIGRHTMADLLAAGHTVRPLDRKPDPDMPGGGIWYDLRDAERLALVFLEQHYDAVIHLAASASLQHSIDDPADDAEHNILGTINLLEACKRHGMGRFVFASTSAVYSPYGDLPYQEDDPKGPQSAYGVSKLAGEDYVRLAAVSGRGMSIAILRYGNVYGPGQKAVGENALVARALDHIYFGTPFVINGDGDQTRDWIHVRDVARANRLAAERQVPIVANIATGEGKSVNWVLGVLAAAAGWQDIFKTHGPAKPGELRDVRLHCAQASIGLGFVAEIPAAEGLTNTAVAWA